MHIDLERDKIWVSVGSTVLEDDKEFTIYSWGFAGCFPKLDLALKTNTILVSDSVSDVDAYVNCLDR